MWIWEPVVRALERAELAGIAATTPVAAGADPIAIRLLALIVHGEASVLIASVVAIATSILPISIERIAGQWVAWSSHVTCVAAPRVVVIRSSVALFSEAMLGT